MRLGEIPGFGIGIFHDGVVVFVKGRYSDGPNEAICEFIPEQMSGGPFISVGRKAFVSVGCSKEGEKLQRFWQMPPEEVEKLEPLIRAKLEEGKDAPF